MNWPTRQISYRIDENTAKRMKAAAMNDGIRELGPFCRLLVEWAFEHYQRAGSLSLLKKSRMEYARLAYPRTR
jgi:hypothetical protein